MIELGLVFPQVPFPGAHRPWKCVCSSCGETVNPRLSGIRMGRRGCRACAIRAASESRRLDEDTARGIFQAAGAEPVLGVPYPGALKPWPSICSKCGSRIQPRLANIQTGHSPCIHCSNSEKGERQRIPDAEARLEMRQRGNAEAKEPYPGAHQPWRCRCLKCNHDITPRLVSIRQGQGACKYCAEKGFDFDRPAVVYLAVLDGPAEEGGPIVKIGIAGRSTGRIRTHERRGWRMVSVTPVRTGQDAYSLEQAVIRAWRDSGAVRAPKSMIPAGDGYTETAFVEDVMPILDGLDLAALVMKLGLGD